MSKHTPGEWYTQQTLTSVGDEVSWAVLCEKDLNAGFVVAMCYGPDAQPNARLIAAAPELLEVLDELVWELDRYGDTGWYDAPSKEKGDAGKLITRARRAIAKATGGDR